MRISCSSVGEPLAGRRDVPRAVGGFVGRCPKVGGGVAPVGVPKTAEGELVGIGAAGDGLAAGIAKVWVASVLLILEAGSVAVAAALLILEAGSVASVMLGIVRMAGGGTGGVLGAGGGVMARLGAVPGAIDERCVSGVISLR